MLLLDALSPHQVSACLPVWTGAGQGLMDGSRMQPVPEGEGEEPAPSGREEGEGGILPEDPDHFAESLAREAGGIRLGDGTERPRRSLLASAPHPLQLFLLLQVRTRPTPGGCGHRCCPCSCPRRRERCPDPLPPPPSPLWIQAPLPAGPGQGRLPAGDDDCGRQGRPGAAPLLCPVGGRGRGLGGRGRGRMPAAAGRAGQRGLPHRRGGVRQRPGLFGGGGRL